MTITTNTTDLEPVLAKGRIVLKDNPTFAAVREALADPRTPEVARTEMVPFPAVPEPVVIDEAVRDALARLKDVFAVVQPSERRALEPTEITAVYEEREVLRKIMGLLAGRDENLKEIVRHHIDVTAEAEGRARPVATEDEDGTTYASTERDSAGHYILCAPKQAERVRIPGTNQDFSSEYRRGTLTFNGGVAQEMLDAGEISREAYLAVTREVRVFDENKAMLAAQKKELQDEILKIIRRGTGYSAPGTSLTVRKTR